MEGYAWPEGSLHLWTGSHTASGNPVAYVQSVQFTPAYRWEWMPTLSGNYLPHLAGKQATLQFGVLYSVDRRLQTLFEAQTAVHIKFTHQHYSGSAGYVGWSARLDSLTLAGSEAGLFTQRLAGECYAWSAF